MSMDDRSRERRVERRTGRRIVAGGVVGAVIGGALGLIAGAFVFTPWSTPHWMMGLAGAILFGGIGLVQGGMAGLEGAHPGSEPSTQTEPLRDEPGWTSPERDERSA